MKVPIIFSRFSIITNSKGTHNLISYASKGLPSTAVNYLIRELELLGLCVIISQFKYFLAKTDFDCTVDHLPLTFIRKSKSEPASTRIKRLLEVLSAYSFNIYSMKGKDMKLSDFLSRIKVDILNCP